MSCQFCGGPCGRVCQGLGFGKGARSTVQRTDIAKGRSRVTIIAGEITIPAKNTPEASGTARKAPSGRLSGRPSSSAPQKGSEGEAEHSSRLPPPRDLTAAVISYVEAMDRQAYGESRKYLTEMRAIVGRPLPEAAKPWLAEGISERTYYRRKAKGSAA